MNQNPDILTEQGNKLFENEKYMLAFKKYEQAYKLNPTFNLNRKIIQTLYLAGNITDIEELVSDFENDYLSNFKDASLIIKALISTNNFLQARQVVRNVHFSNEVGQIDNLNFEIDLAANKYLIEHRNNIKSLKERAKSIVIEPMAEQVNFIHQLKYLSLNDYLKNTELLLENPWLHPLFKSSIAEDLVKLKITHKMGIYYFDKNTTFIPCNCPLISDLKALNYLKIDLNKISPNLSPIELNSVESELNLYAAMLYPFTDQIIDDPQLWIEVILVHFGIKKSALNLENSVKAGRVDRWLSKFEKLLNLFNS